MEKIFNALLTAFSNMKNFVFKKSDPAMLVFLLLVTNYRMSFKIATLVLVYIYRPKFRFERSGIFYFYTLICLTGIVNLVFISRDFSLNHVSTVLAGCLFWIAGLLTFHQLKLFTERNTIEKIVNTLKIITVLNCVVSAADLVKIMLATHALNPFSTPSPPPYGVNSGDLIGGIFGELHLVNAIVCCMLFVFFLYRKNFLFALLALFPFLLTGSNLCTLIILAALAFMLITRKDRSVKYYSLFSIALILSYYTKVTPTNYDYLKNTIGIKTPERVILVIDEEAKKRAEIDSLYTSWHQVQTVAVNPVQEHYVPHADSSAAKAVDSSANASAKVNLNQIKIQEKEKEKELDYIAWHAEDSLKKVNKSKSRFEYGKLDKFDIDHKPGKLISFIQTKDFLLTDWRNFLFGSGIGGFSSRLAFYNSGILNDSRILMSLPKYESSAFKDNHKALFKYIEYSGTSYHSVMHLPFSGYNQILGEYGIIGFILFMVCYIGYFVARMRSLLSYGKLLLALILMFFFFDYWYERLSVMIFFELLMLLDLKINLEEKQKTIQ